MSACLSVLYFLFVFIFPGIALSLLSNVMDANFIRGWASPITIQAMW
jgi:hypothetical protein